MSSPFVAEIRIFGFNFPPTGWAYCNGQLLPISQNTALFSLLGTFYGGDGKSTFALPDLQGAAATNQGQGQGLQQWFLGEQQGSEFVTLLQSEMPAHNHFFMTTSVNGTNQTYLADCQVTTTNTYTPFNSSNAQVQMNANSITIAGGSQPHDNIQPTLCVTYIISLFGIFPHQ